MNAICRVRIDVSGRVQGVGYRYSAMVRARALGLAGWVRNRPDGSVSLEVQGSEESVNEMIAWCKAGPQRAMVESIEVDRIRTKTDETFRIL